MEFSVDRNRLLDNQIYHLPRHPMRQLKFAKDENVLTMDHLKKLTQMRGQRGQMVFFELQT